MGSGKSLSNRFIDQTLILFCRNLFFSCRALLDVDLSWIMPVIPPIVSASEQGLMILRFSHSVILAVDASLHVAMDKYAMICITCSEKFLDKYIKIITAENEAWESHLANHGEDYLRNLKVSWVRPLGVFLLALILFINVDIRPLCSFR